MAGEYDDEYDDESVNPESNDYGLFLDSIAGPNSTSSSSSATAPAPQAQALPAAHAPQAISNKGMQAAPTAAPDVANAEKKDDDFNAYLRNWATQNQTNRDMMFNAEDAANSNRAFAQIGQAAANFGGALAKAAPLNQKPFEDLQASANAPVTATESMIKQQGNNDKILRDYVLSKRKAEMAQQSHNDLQAHRAKTEAENADWHKQLGGVLAGRNDIAKGGLALRQGNQAVQAADKYSKDPVVKMTTTQLAATDKGLNIINDTKQPFTILRKNEIEKDLANIVSNGNSSSLGQVHRTEFNPGVVKAQAVIDFIQGYQGDIKDPGYKAQLRAMLMGLKENLTSIQVNARKRVDATYGTAFSGNPLAKQVMKENSNFAPAPPQQLSKPQQNKATGATRTVYSDDGGATWHP